jgi:flagellar hook-basal body complex protein FliE
MSSPIPFSIDAVAAVSPAREAVSGPQMTARAPQVSFEQLLMNGIEGTNTKLLDAERASAAFALDADMPPHRVAFAIEEARLSFEMMMQVRTRMLDAYQQLMNMQL